MVSDKPSSDSPQEGQHQLEGDHGSLLAPALCSSVNGDTYLSMPKKMRLPLALDLALLISEAGRGAWLFSCDMSRAYRQLLLDPADLSLVCFQEASRFFMDANLPFSLRCAAATCQDTTSIITSRLNSQGFILLNYIDDFGGVTASKQLADHHFKWLQATMGHLGLVGAKHKASPTPLSAWCGWG